MKYKLLPISNSKDLAQQHTNTMAQLFWIVHNQVVLMHYIFSNSVNDSQTDEIFLKASIANNVLLV